VPPVQFPYPERINCARIPTPIEEFNFLQKESGEFRLLIKRDDLTECAACGNKARKLQFLLAEARQRGADLIITCGGIQSNHARATAVLGTRLGFKIVLVLRGEEPPEIDGNLFIDRLLGVEIRYITRAVWNDRLAIMEEIALEKKKQGRESYIIPEGASNALGSVGYVHAVQEIKAQLVERNEEIDYIVTATGSGGTQAGLIIGCRLYLPNVKVLGFNVCDDEAYFRNKIGELIGDTEERFGTSFSISDDDIAIADGYVGRGYAISRDEELMLIHDVARRTGIVLDPVYNGKAFYGLTKELEKGRLHTGRKSRPATILFLHTGGIFGLFSKKKEFHFSL
jgi:D-cysteine desulfhydrase